MIRDCLDCLSFIIPLSAKCVPAIFSKSFLATSLRLMSPLSNKSPFAIIYSFWNINSASFLFTVASFNLKLVNTCTFSSLFQIYHIICPHLPFCSEESNLTQIWWLDNGCSTPPAQVNNLLKMQNGSGGGSSRSNKLNLQTLKVFQC